MTLLDRRETCSTHNVDNFDAMDLVDVDNEVVGANDEDVMVADDEEVFRVSSSWSNASANSSTIR